MTSAPLSERLVIVCASNDDACLRRNLLASELVTRHAVPVHVERGARSASIAYNRGIDATSADYVVFAHQDVYLPPRWHEDLTRAIAWLDVNAPNWALLAPFGMTAEGAHVGDVWTTCLSARVGRPVDPPVPVESFDELVIVLRRDSDLRFDEGLPLWHFYGTDIVQTAREAGRSAHVGALPVVHNDGFKARLGADFTTGYRYMQRKWREVLPIRTPILWLTRYGLDLPIYRLRAWKGLKARRLRAGDPATDPRVFSAQVGWE